MLSSRLCEDDKGAAEVNVTECTTEPTAYNHPTNHNIKFWDLPGIGTPNYPDLETYCEKVNLEKYHTFLIFTASRFTENDLELAKKIREIKKTFLFIRTKIDENVRAEKRKRSFNEEAMLEKIRRNCVESLGDLLSNERDIFLINNHDPDKWDFARLTQAILDALTRYQRESLTLSLGNASNVTRLSSDILQRKVDVLRGRIWMVASASAAAALVPLPGLSFAVDAALILKELRFYRSQLGLPEMGSAEFARLHLATKDKVLKVCLTTASELSEFLAPKTAVEKFIHFIPLVGPAMVSRRSFDATHDALTQLLKNVEEAAVSVLKELTTETLPTGLTIE